MAGFEVTPEVAANQVARRSLGQNPRVILDVLLSPKLMLRGI
jgi:hypothetical protein